MNVLVTGATGFIGSYLVERLLGRGARVRALVRPSTDASALEAAGVEVLRGDVRGPDAVRRAMADREVVYHLAKASSGSSSSTLQSVNGEGARNVAGAAVRAGVARLVYASTAAVYGTTVAGAAVREDAPFKPDTAYARSKVLAERVLRSSHERESLPVVFARITSVIGPGAAASRNLFAAVEARRLRMIGAGDNRQHPADVLDIVEGLLLCGATPGVEGQAYNLAGTEPLPLRELVRLIARELGGDGQPPKSLPVAPFLAYRWLSDLLCRAVGVGLPRADGIGYLMSDRVLDIARARRELGYAPRFSPQETIRRTAEWYRSGPTRSTRHAAATSARP